MTRLVVHCLPDAKRRDLLPDRVLVARLRGSRNPPPVYTLLLDGLRSRRGRGASTSISLAE
ncbi:MAG: hypothetical protein HYY06_19020 [Deltaproteobacteria bacterium]|nr:hypothetical protein [Deltaproteobacteria bacterium]